MRAPRLCPCQELLLPCLLSAAPHQEPLLLLSPPAVGLSSLPTTPFFFSSFFSGPKGKQGWIRWAWGQQC